MATNRLVFEGLAELKAALRALPAELAGEAGNLVDAAGNTAAVAIRTGYGRHRRTGNLQDHVSVVTVEAGPFGRAVIVKSTARHAALFEHGTQARHTAIGANRGAMPPGHVFVPVMVRTRRTLYEQLADLLRRNGLAVSGA